MSGNPTGSNVVPMPHAQAPAPTGAPPQMPMPGMWGGGTLPWGPGCCPPGGMDALLKCYCDVQAATAFICSVMVQCIQTNPAVTAAIIAAIEASGSSLPLIGVTNGTDAQPGQVGEWYQLQQLNVPYAGTGLQSGVLSMGILQPGDWTIWAWMGVTSPVLSLQFTIDPLPTGFTSDLNSFNAQATADMLVLASGTGRALISVPSLVVMTWSVNATAAGVFDLQLQARRAR